MKKILLVVYDFDGVMTDNKVYIDQKGNEMVQVNRADGLGVAEIKKMGVQQIIISTEKNPVVSARASKLGILCMQDIENQHGRIRKERWGPRTLDLDILIFGKEIIQDKNLTVPHPEIEKRPFVLVPLAEIDSNCSIPGVGMISDLLAVNDQKDLELLHE